MLYNIFSMRAIQVGVAFFLMVVGGSLLYSWYVHHTTEDVLARHNLTQHAERNETDVPEDTHTDKVDFEQTATPLDIDDSQMAEDTDVAPIDEATEFADVVDAFFPEDFVSEVAPAEDVPVSPYGFGPYPEVPADYPGTTPMWERDLDALGFSEAQKRDSELLSRVLIKLWVEQGVGSYLGGSVSHNTGLVYPHFENTIYVKRTVQRNPDGTVNGVFARIKTPGNMFIGAEEMERFRLTGETPPGVRVLQLDTDGIDPYEFLNLQR